MPVRFEKSSEYDRNYTWVDSFLSKDFNPSVDQLFPPAGVASVDIANLCEPKLQSRRKPVDVTRTSTTYQDSMPAHHDDYILVGDQSKFAPSVKYRVLGKGKGKGRGHPEPQPMGGDSHKDYCKKHGRVHRHRLRRPVSASPLIRVSSKQQGWKENGFHQLPTAERSPPPAPRERDIAPIPKRKPGNYMPRPTKPIAKTCPDPPRRKEPSAKPHIPKLNVKEPEPEATRIKSIVKSRPPPAPSKEPVVKSHDHKAKCLVHNPEVVAHPEMKPPDLREKRKGKFNEFAQTELSKGVADSGQEATDDYAMKYRAGCPPPRPRGPKRLSEYQMQFQWKKGVGASPMLAAEQLIYNSNPQLAPYSNPYLPPKVSEYKNAFKKYDYKPVPVETVQPKKAKLQRSKSMEAVTPDRLHAAGLRSGKVSQEDKRLVRESANPTHLLFPHGKVKYTGSEYATNYQNPMRYSYDDGVWKGADPPQVQPDMTPIPVTALPAAADVAADTAADAAAEPWARPSTSWFNEVLELRSKAAEYKQRARGTHFSRQHLAQLYAQQADLWDTVSNSSMLSALSLESAHTMANRVDRKAAALSGPSSGMQIAGPKPKPQVPKPRVPKLAWAGEQSSPTQSTSSRKKSKCVASSHGSTPGSRAAGSGDTPVEGSGSSQQGRLPTPKFRHDYESADYKWRHHLDRTTPAVGGALLTSPPQVKKKTALRTDSSAPSKVRCTCRSDDSEDGSDPSPTYRIQYPDPPYVRHPRERAEHVQLVRTHTGTPLFHLLPELPARHVNQSCSSLFRSTSRPVMVPQVAARLVDPYHQHGVEERVVDGPHADGYVNPVYLGEGEIMQPSAVAYISPEDTRYALVPRYVPRTLPYPAHLGLDPGEVTPTPTRADGSGQVSASCVGPLATSGMPTRDSHVLVDEQASMDRPLSTKFTHSPPIDKHVKKHLGVAVMPTLRETARELQSNSSATVDDDAISVSVQSVASSCSLASEVLERARNRRNEFWGNNGKKSSCSS